MRHRSVVFRLAIALACVSSAASSGKAKASPYMVDGPVTTQAVTPADNTTGVPINVTLSWTAGAAPRFDVYFGTTNPPAFQARVDGPSFVLETLRAATTYYWRVDSVAGSTVTRGPVRRFTTARDTTRDGVYAWPIRIATSVRALYPKAAELGNWNYTDGIIADALYRIAEKTGRDDDIAYVRAYLDTFVSPDGSIDAKAYPFELYSLDRIRPAASLLWMYDRTHEAKYLTAAKYVASQLDKQPRTSDGGYWHRSTYPNQMWLDGIYMADVYAVQFATKTGQPRYFDEAVKQIVLVYTHTHDPKTGLCYHGWDETKSRPWANKETGTSPEFWGRAIGWYVMAMADVMDWLPRDHPGHQTVLPIFQSVCRSLVKYQDRDTGMWYQIVDKATAPKNYVETSSTLMFAYAMARGAERGWLPPEFLEHARRATRGVLNHKVDLLPGNRMDIRGTVQVGSLGGDGGFYDYYVSVPVVTNDQKAIGAFMFLSTALSEIANGSARQANDSPTQRSPFSPALERPAVLNVMTAAADRQLDRPSSHAPYDWTQAAFYTGMMALAGVADSPKYFDAMRAMGERNQWRPGLRPGHADDYAVIATYAKIFEREKNKAFLEPALALFNFLAARKYDEPLAWGGAIETRELAWCDALFMGPPAMAAVAAATGDRQYLDLANRLWWKTTDYLYDKGEKLYFRDSRYFDQREKNGRKVFWSRGNGWVIAGLARLLQDMPADYADRGRYVTLFKEMAGKVRAVQGADGYWRSSLLDPESRPNPETSGTGFFTYALAWGINSGLLDRATYEPSARRGWEAMVRAVHADGMLGWVQQIGAEPGSATFDSTEVYGVGALLLAGSEMVKLASPGKS